MNKKFALAHRIVGKFDGEAMAAERLCFSHFNQHRPVPRFPTFAPLKPGCGHLPWRLDGLS
jgi:hypothetical protein